MNERGAAQRIVLVSLCAVVSEANHASAQTDLRYRVVDLGVIDSHGIDARSDAFAINDLDQVTGWSHSGVYDDPFLPFLWSNGEMIDLGCIWEPWRAFLVGTSINNLGHVAGYYRDSSSADGKGFFWSPGAGMQEVGVGLVREYVSTTGINARDEVIVNSLDIDRYGSFLWRHGKLTPLDGSTFTRVSGVNEQGVIVGVTDNGATAWIDEQPRAIGQDWNPSDINDRNQICGIFSTGSPTTPYGICIWSHGERHDLGMYWAYSAYAQPPRINNAGELVLNQPNAAIPRALFRDGEWHSLDDLLDDASRDWVLDSVTDINDAGRITGFSWSKGGKRLEHAVMLVPNELRLAGPIPGVAGTVNMIRCTGATPGARVRFVYGVSAGRRSIAQCPDQYLDIRQPILLGESIADAQGEARLEVFVPRSARGEEVILQAVDSETCEPARAIWHRF